MHKNEKLTKILEEARANSKDSDSMIRLGFNFFNKKKKLLSINEKTTTSTCRKLQHEKSRNQY